MKVNLIDAKGLVCMNSEDIPAGTVFFGKIGGYKSRIFLKSYSCVVDLEDPVLQWGTNPTIENYIELEAELTVRKKA